MVCGLLASAAPGVKRGRDRRSKIGDGHPHPRRHPERSSVRAKAGRNAVEGPRGMTSGVARHSTGSLPPRLRPLGCLADSARLRYAHLSASAPLPMNLRNFQRRVNSRGCKERRHSCRRPRARATPNLPVDARPSRHLSARMCASGASGVGDRNVAAPCASAPVHPAPKITSACSVPQDDRFCKGHPAPRSTPACSVPQPYPCSSVSGLT